MKNVFKRIGQMRELCKPFQGAFTTLFVLIMFGQCIALVTPYYYGKMVDGLITKKPIDTLLWYVGIVFVANCLHRLIDW